MLVVSDSSPLHYLILIEREWLLPKLYERIVVPTAVLDELSHSRAPEAVRRWITKIPSWIELRKPKSIVPGLESLGLGEAAAISLARELSADVILIDEALGRKTARSLGLLVTGTLGILETAAIHGLISLADDLAALENTNYHRTPTLFANLLRLHKVK